MNLRRTTLSAPVAGFCLAAFAGAAAAGTLSGNVDLGYTASSGNTKTSNLDAKFGLGYVVGPWTHKLKLGVISASKDNQSTAERYTASGKTEYDFTEHNYVFGQGQYIKDRFAGVRQNLTLTAGYGRRVINSPVQSLDAEIGAGFRRTQEQAPSLRWRSDAIAQLGADYKYKLSDTGRFEQQLSIQSGHVNTFTESVTSLKLAVMGNLSAKLSYTVDHNSTVPAGLSKTDTYTSVALSYQFGKTPELASSSGAGIAIASP
ncbi:MAG TPA: DUF481 domain-containing protein [Gammaproteobacteria bacterium]|nr:DUF481 domain-containing protein [Gammaproteobacteria bacterium]